MHKPEVSDKLKRRKFFLKSFKDTIPILFVYIPAGIIYGLLFGELGYHWFWASLTALVVMSGTGQYISIGLLAVGAEVGEIFLTTFFVNFRHIFYGFSLISRFRCKRLKKIYLILALTDETYSILTTKRIKDKILDEKYYTIITILNHSYWVIGCTLGAMLSSGVELKMEGVDFVLTALFVVLALEQYKQVKDPIMFIITAIAGFAALSINKEQMLLIAIAIVSISLFAKSKLPLFKIFSK